MALNRFWTFFLGTLFVSAGLFFTSLSGAQVLASVPQERQALAQQGYTPWQWQLSSCQNCELFILPLRAEVRTEKVMAFVQALAAHKTEIRNLYTVSSAEYNFLAHMSMGILGRESLFFESKRYYLKETFPDLIRAAKVIRSYFYDVPLSDNSRGPTQIKKVPERIARHYQVTPENLYIPQNAAVATMGFLIESLQELKNRIVSNRLDFITPGNYIDYLPYLYFGSTRALLNGTATPESNIYVKNMKNYMSWFELYERAPAPLLH
ncbi:MAG: hypothetical protein AAGB31_15715 [Bdellovibrio sp.]